MNWLETARTSLAAVRSHRLRSLLTMLGILIGIAAVILTVGLGEGAQKQVSDQINALGSNLLIVSPGSSTSSTGVRGGFGSASTLTDADATALASKVSAPDIAAVAPTTSTEEELTAGSTNWTTSVVGATPSWLDVRARSVTEGRFITAHDVSSDAAVVVLGSETASELFSGRDPIGQTVTIADVPFQVVGLLNSVGSGSSATADQDDQAIVPLSTATTRVIGGNSRTSVSDIYLEASSGGTITAAYQEANSELLALHGITTATDADFTIASQQSILSTATSVDKTLTVLLAGIAAISLLVGGIGVMNIMLVSVTERVREIGLRKALGATPRAIRRQFLFEASVLGLSGGVLGVVLGIVGAIVLPHFISDPISISPAAAGAAIAVAVAIGIGFGVYPASRAARLAPIDALRSE
ncbi:MAG TPA: ABC transporter permease [Mycobacteriales bacterium]|jgi:putative ABC transport system permease protein|nr:ABC transporter permease [Mycobacteriales bacterium]